MWCQLAMTMVTVDKIVTVNGRWLTVNKIAMVDGDGGVDGNGWQSKCARTENGTGNKKEVEIGKHAAASPCNSPNNHDQASAW